jgi:hypothetical protein
MKRRLLAQDTNIKISDNTAPVPTRRFALLAETFSSC